MPLVNVLNGADIINKISDENYKIVMDYNVFTLHNPTDGSVLITDNTDATPIVANLQMSNPAKHRFFTKLIYNDASDTRIFEYNPVHGAIGGISWLNLPSKAGGWITTFWDGSVWACVSARSNPSNNILPFLKLLNLGYNPATVNSEDDVLYLDERNDGHERLRIKFANGTKKTIKTDL